jgi:predicted alpha/beta hydrolase family esterase
MEQGHLNAASELGLWEEAKILLNELIQTLQDYRPM